MPNQYQLTFPLKDKSILQEIQTGDTVFVNGIIVTSRDMAHKFYTEKLSSNDPLFLELSAFLKNGLIYHCGPVIDLKRQKVLSAGPTTSIREEPYQDKVIQSFDLAGIIGKGGMGEKTLQALHENTALYLHAVGGAGSFYGESLKVLKVFMLEEFGMPEAVWVLEARNFYTIVTMDSHEKSLHNEIEKISSNKLETLIGLKKH